MRQTPRLWTTARFRESILPKWTREQDFLSRFARNTHHSYIFLLDICDAITFLLSKQSTQQYFSIGYLRCCNFFVVTKLSPSSFKVTLFAFCLVNLHSCNLHNCNLHSCSLHYCNLHSCNCSLHTCNLHSCDLHSCNLHNCNLHNCCLRSCCGLHSCTLHICNLNVLPSASSAISNHQAKQFQS